MLMSRASLYIGTMMNSTRCVMELGRWTMCAQVAAQRQKQDELHKKREDDLKQAATDSLAERDRARRAREACSCNTSQQSHVTARLLIIRSDTCSK